MKTFIHVEMTIEQIEALPLIGKTINNWRQRNVTLREHPTDPTMLISDGISFDSFPEEKKVRVIAEEKRECYTTALSYIEQGLIYIYH